MSDHFLVVSRSVPYEQVDEESGSLQHPDCFRERALKEQSQMMASLGALRRRLAVSRRTFPAEE
jgi:hypothetical protein